MSDDRLFASNNAIGRKWYYLNILILIGILFATRYIFKGYIIPNVVNLDYDTIARSILYFLYFSYAITFLSLMDRRLYDICDSRSDIKYKQVSGFIQLTVVGQIIVLILKAFYIETGIFDSILQVMWIIVAVIAIAIGLIKGQITGLTYSQYRKKAKYKL